MRLALEGLGVVQPQRTIVDALIDQIQLIEAEDALRDSLEEVDVLLHTYHSLESIQYAIQKCGVTQSIVQLYGENFSSMESDQTGDAEKEVEEKKQGVLGRAWEAIKNLFRKFIDWIKRLFTRAMSLKGQLKQIEKKAAHCKYPLEVSGLLTSELMKEITSHISGFELYFTGTLSRRIQSHDEFLKRVENAISTEHKEEFRTAQDVINRSRDFQDYLSELPHYQEALDRQIANPREAFHVNSETAMDELLELTKYKILVCKKSMEAVTISAQRLISAIDKAQK